MSKKRREIEDEDSLPNPKRINFFDKEDYEVASVLLELYKPVVFSSNPPLFHQWGHTKKRSCYNQTNSQPHIKKELEEEIVTKKHNSQPIKEDLEEDFLKKKQNSSQRNIYSAVLKIHKEMSLISRTQVGLVSQHALTHGPNLQPLTSVDRTVHVRDDIEPRGVDLRPPAFEEGNVTVRFERVITNRVQAAAQARQRRLALIRNKRLSREFSSSR